MSAAVRVTPVRPFLSFSWRTPDNHTTVASIMVLQINQPFLEAFVKTCHAVGMDVPTVVALLPRLVEVKTPAGELYVKLAALKAATPAQP